MSEMDQGGQPCPHSHIVQRGVDQVGRTYHGAGLDGADGDGRQNCAHDHQTSHFSRVKTCRRDSLWSTAWGV